MRDSSALVLRRLRFFVAVQRWLRLEAFTSRARLEPLGRRMLASEGVDSGS